MGKDLVPMSAKGKVPEDTPAIDSEERRKVRRALKLMRKACVKQSKSQQELSKYSGGSGEIDKKSLLPYSEKLEVVIKDFDALMSDAKVNYSLVLEKKKFQLASMKLGKPRSIFPHLVGEVVKDEEERLYKEKHPEIPDPNILTLAKPDTLSRKKKLAPLPSPSSKSPDINMPSTSPLQGDNTNCMERTSFTSLSSGLGDLSPGKSMSLSSSTTNSKANLKDKISSAKARKEMLLKQKEDELKQSLENRDLVREDERRRIDETQRKMFLHKGTLLYITMLAYFEPLKTKLLAYRKEIYDLKYASKTEKSIRFISNWWFFKRLELRIFRTKVVQDRLRVFVRSGWSKIQRDKRNQSAELCKTFIRDSTGLSETVRKVYAFRKKVICLQKHAKSWLAIQKARMQILWMTMDKIVKMRIESDKIEKIRKEKSALKAIAKLNGFGNKLLEMNTLKKNLDRLLTQQQKNMKKTLASQSLEDEETNVLTKSIGLETKNNNGTSDKKLSMYAKSKESWWNRVAKDPRNKNKLKLVQNVLQKQRSRHISSITAETKNKLVEVRLDVSHARDLLKVLVPKIEENSTTRSKKMSKKAALTRAKTQKIRPEQDQKLKMAPNPFLMLTKGGLADLVEITTAEWLKAYRQD